MNMTVYHEGSIYQGRIVSYSFMWEGRQIDMAMVRELDLDIARQRGLAKFVDGTRLSLIKGKSFLGRRMKVVLEGHVIIHIESLNADIRFDVKRVEKMSYERNGTPQESKSPDHAPSHNGSANGSAVKPLAANPRLSPVAEPMR